MRANLRCNSLTISTLVNFSLISKTKMIDNSLIINALVDFVYDFL